MNVKEDSTPKTAPKKKREHNKFVYNVVNQLTLSEFKRYTNIRELMKIALMKRDETERQQLDYYIKQNFKQNIPNETLWKKGGFVSLKFVSDFYETEAARRAFRNVFGTKKCSVNLEAIHFDRPEEADMHLQIDTEDHDFDIANVGLENCQAEIGNLGLTNHEAEVEMRKREDEIEKIDLTKDDADVCMYTPKRLALKYPRKRVVCVAEPSDVVENICETKFEEIGHTQHSMTVDMLNDEINISSTEDTIPKKTIEGLAIISDVTLVPAPETPPQKESAHLSKHNIGPKSLFEASSPHNCRPKNVLSQSPILQAKSPIREVQSPMHQGQVSIRETQSSKNQKTVLQKQSGIMIPESSTRNNTQETFNICGKLK